MTKTRGRFICWMLIGFLGPLFSFGQTGLPKIESDVIDISLKKALGDRTVTGRIPILILFEKQGSLREGDELFEGLSKSRRRSGNIAWLKDLSGRSFTEFSSRLGKNGPAAGVRTGRRFWLINGVEATASRRAIDEISSWAGVARIYLRTEKAPELIRMGKKQAKLFMRDFPKPPRFKGSFNMEGKQIGWNLRRMRADEVWKQGYTGRGVIVAVLDGGVNYGHPDIRNNLWVNEKEIPENGKDDDQNGYVDDYLGWNFAEQNQNIEDMTSHGSNCSGIVVGDGTGGTITGVAPQASLMVMKYYTRYNNEEISFRTIWKASQYDAWESLQYALVHGAQVASLSMSYDGVDDPPYAAWRYAAANAVSCGLTMVVAASNDRETYKQYEQIHLPGNIPEVISVGAIGQAESIASYSSAGPVTWESVSPFKDFPLPAGLIKPDVCAPVEGFPDVDYDSPGYSYPGGGGTSSATPHVAGLVALMLEKDPELMPWEIKKRLEETSVDRGAPGKDNLYGAGRVDAWEAVNYGSGPNFSLPEVRIDGGRAIYVRPGEAFDVRFRVTAGPVSRINAVLYDPTGQVTLADEAQTLTVPELKAGGADLTLTFKLSSSGSDDRPKKAILDLVLGAEAGRKFFFKVPVYIGRSDLLVVDDDGPGESEKAVLETLDHDRRYYNYINTRFTPLDGEILKSYKQVIWLTGEEFYNTLDAPERSLLEGYLDGGGSLTLFGENIGEDIGKSAFYRDYLHAKLIKERIEGRKADPFVISGKDGDPLSQRLALTIRNYYYHSQFDIVRPLTGADDPFRGEPDEDYAGFVRFTGKYKLIYSALGMESIRDADARSEFLGRILDWFEK